MSKKQHPQNPASADVDHLARLTRSLAVCSRALHRLFSEELAEFDLTPTEFILLWTCRQSRNSAMSQNQLAATIGVSPAQLSQTAERLHRQGCIALTRSAADRRRQFLELTPEGAALLDTAKQRLKSPATKILRDFPDSLHTQVATLLHQLAPVAQQFTTRRSAQTTNSNSQEREAA